MVFEETKGFSTVLEKSLRFIEKVWGRAKPIREPSRRIEKFSKKHVVKTQVYLKFECLMSSEMNEVDLEGALNAGAYHPDGTSSSYSTVHVLFVH